MRHKPLFPLLLLLCTLLLCACSAPAEPETVESPEPITLSIWLYDTQGEDIQPLLSSLLDKEKVALEFTLLQEDEQYRLTAAMEANMPPDLIIGDLDHLHHAMSTGAKPIDLSGFALRNSYRRILEDCTKDGMLFALPLAMNIKTMAINYELFKQANALAYVDESTHTWTTEQFLQAVQALQKYNGTPHVLAVYCGAQNGDDATRTFVENLYGGHFSNGRRYTVSSDAMQTAFATLAETDGIVFDENIVDTDENLLFAREQLAMTLSWDITQPLPESFTAFPMSYPAQDETGAFPARIWGVSVYDNADEARLEAAQELLSALIGSTANYRRIVNSLACFPVRPLYGYDEVYSAFCPYAASSDVQTPGFPVARTQWYKLLQRIGNGGDVALETASFVENANAAARAAER